MVAVSSGRLPAVDHKFIGGIRLGRATSGLRRLSAACKWRLASVGLLLRCRATVPLR